jgi:hypothetical protein
MKFPTRVILKREKSSLKITLFLKHTEFFLVEIGVQQDGGRRILLGVNTGIGTVMLQPIRF